MEGINIPSIKPSKLLLMFAVYSLSFVTDS
jgi:hypothetical protein